MLVFKQSFTFLKPAVPLNEARLKCFDLKNHCKVKVRLKKCFKDDSANFKIFLTIFILADFDFLMNPLMEQHALKNVNSCQDTKTYSYLVTSGC
jgi:hypothetical protein